MSHASTSLVPHKQRLLAVQLACATAILAACGGGGGGSVDATGAAAPGGSSAAQSVALQTYITDNLATDYQKVWVSIKKITAVDANGAEVTLLDASAAPAVVNLSSLAAVGQWMSTASVKPGVYTEVRVTLVNGIQLVSLDGQTTITAKLAASGADVVVKVANLTLDPASSGQLVLDFNLAKFTYDAASGLVVPTVEAPRAQDAFDRFVHQQATVNGTVHAVDAAAQTLTVDDKHLGDGVVVRLATDAVIVDVASGKAVQLSEVALGAHVEIRGTVQPGATTADPATVVASVVHIEAAQAPAVQTVAGAGKVGAVHGSLVTVLLSDASFLPGANSVVVDVGAAHFAHGAAGDLAPGVVVAFRGALSGSGASATVLAGDIDVQGAPSAQERAAHPEQRFSAINGQIATLNPDGSFTVQQARADGPVVVPGLYRIDPQQATYLAGNASCIAVGAVVQAVGALVDSTLSARFLNVKDCAGEVHAEPQPLPPQPVPPSPAPGASEPR